MVELISGVLFSTYLLCYVLYSTTTTVVWRRWRRRRVDLLPFLLTFICVLDKAWLIDMYLLLFPLLMWIWFQQACVTYSLGDLQKSSFYPRIRMSLGVHFGTSHSVWGAVYFVTGWNSDYSKILRILITSCLIFLGGKSCFSIFFIICKLYLLYFIRKITTWYIFPHHCSASRLVFVLNQLVFSQ